MNIWLVNDYQFPIIGCFFVFFAMISYWISLIFPKNNQIFNISKVLVLFSNITFTLSLLFRWLNEKYFPLSNLYESLIFLSWGLSALHLLIEKKTKSRIIGSISTPIIFFLSAFSSYILPHQMQKASPLVPSLQSNWLMMHVSMMMISYTALILGSLLSILYLSFNLFNKKASFIINSDQRSQIGAELNYSKSSLLQTIDIWSYRIIGFGFPFLTIGIISGAVWANEAWGSYWSWDPKETWALITWLLFAIYLHARLLKGWQGEKAAIISSFGFFMIWICYLGVNFLGKGLHTYGWVLN